MKRPWSDNGLSLAFFALFAAALVGQAIAGHAAFNEERLDHDQATVSMGRYLLSSSFGQAMLENWQSEYLQFTLYIFLTVWLIQRGSNESKEPGRAGAESDEEQKLGEHATPESPKWARAGGWRTTLYSNSLVLVMATIWIGSWVGQSVTGWSDYNSQQLVHGGASVSWWEYVGKADFWEQTLQNWQSEFLAVGSMVVFSIWLRQRGSPESKPVGSSHGETAAEG